MKIAFFSLLPLNVKKACIFETTLRKTNINPGVWRQTNTADFPDSLHRIQEMGDGGDQGPEEVSKVLPDYVKNHRDDQEAETERVEIER